MKSMRWKSLRFRPRLARYEMSSAKEFPQNLLLSRKGDVSGRPSLLSIKLHHKFRVLQDQHLELVLL